MLIHPVTPKPPVTLPDPTPETPVRPTAPTTLPDHPQYHPPMPTIIDNIASRPLFAVKSFVFILLSVLSWAGSNFFGVPGLDIVAWAGPDTIMTIGELLSGIFMVVAGYFTKNRVPGAIEGVFSSPEVMTVTKMTLTKKPTVVVKAVAAKAEAKADRINP